MLEQNERTIVATALTHWINYIQTGDITLAADDAKNLKMEIKPLNMEQMRFIVKLDEIKQKVIGGKPLN